MSLIAAGSYPIIAHVLNNGITDIAEGFTMQCSDFGNVCHCNSADQNELSWTGIVPFCAEPPPVDPNDPGTGGSGT